MSRPEHFLTKCTSFSSVESDQSEGLGNRNGVLLRAGTMSEGVLSHKDRHGNNSRPKSEIPQGGSCRELETSFEVSPFLT